MARDKKKTKQRSWSETERRLTRLLLARFNPTRLTTGQIAINEHIAASSQTKCFNVCARVSEQCGAFKFFSEINQYTTSTTQALVIPSYLMQDLFSDSTYSIPYELGTRKDMLDSMEAIKSYRVPETETIKERASEFWRLVKYGCQSIHSEDAPASRPEFEVQEIQQSRMDRLNLHFWGP